MAVGGAEPLLEAVFQRMEVRLLAKVPAVRTTCDDLHGRLNDPMLST